MLAPRVPHPVPFHRPLTGPDRAAIRSHEPACTALHDAVAGSQRLTEQCRSNGKALHSEFAGFLFAVADALGPEADVDIVSIHQCPAVVPAQSPPSPAPHRSRRATHHGGSVFAAPLPVAGVFAAAAVAAAACARGNNARRPPRPTTAPPPSGPPAGRNPLSPPQLGEGRL
eukprot:gene42516-16009_t